MTFLRFAVKPCLWPIQPQTHRDYGVEHHRCEGVASLLSMRTQLSDEQWLPTPPTGTCAEVAPDIPCEQANSRVDFVGSFQRIQWNIDIPPFDSAGGDSIMAASYTVPHAA